MHPEVSAGLWAYEHTLYDSHSAGYVVTKELVINAPPQPRRKGVQDTPDCSRWSRRWCDIGNELDERSYSVVGYCFWHHVVGFSSPWYCYSPATITLKNSYLASSYHRPEARRHFCCMWVSRCVSRRLAKHATRLGCRVYHCTIAWYNTCI
jgi:hypothetical protein